MWARFMGEKIGSIFLECESEMMNSQGINAKKSSVSRGRWRQPQERDGLGSQAGKDFPTASMNNGVMMFEPNNTHTGMAQR